MKHHVIQTKRARTGWESQTVCLGCCWHRGSVTAELDGKWKLLYSGAESAKLFQAGVGICVSLQELCWWMEPTRTLVFNLGS